MVWLWCGLRSLLGFHQADRRLAAKLDASIVVVMIAANAVCLTRIGVVVMV